MSHLGKAGERRGGRKKGTPNKATAARLLRARAGIFAAEQSGMMPLDIILTVARGGEAAARITDRQFAAAVAAAPFLHARLSAVAVKDVTPDDTDVSRRQAEVRAILLARLEEMAVPRPL